MHFGSFKNDGLEKLLSKMMECFITKATTAQIQGAQSQKRYRGKIDAIDKTRMLFLSY